MKRLEYIFCPYCGVKLKRKLIGGRIRPYCKLCNYIQFLNPTVGVAVIIIENKRLLMGKRAKNPFKGKWCIPCGHVEWGEDIREAAKREFLEETGLEVEILDVFEVLSNFHDPYNLTVGVWFKGKVKGGNLKAQDDLEEVKFFHRYEIKNHLLAFETDIKVIEKLKNEGLI